MSRWSLCVIVVTAAIVVGVLALWIARGSNDGVAREPVSHQDRTSEVASMVPRQFEIEGMACQGCADTITSALAQIPGVRSAEVSFEDKRAVVLAEPSQVPTEKIVAAIADAGYQGKPAAAAKGR